MLKKGNVYQYKNKLWVYAGFVFTGDKNSFTHYRFYPANKEKLTQRDVSSFKRDVFKHMKLDQTATVLYGRPENDEQLNNILTGKYFKEENKWQRAGTSIAMNVKYDLKHIATIFKKGLDVHGYHDCVVVWDSMCATPTKSK